MCGKYVERKTMHESAQLFLKCPVEHCGVISLELEVKCLGSRPNSIHFHHPFINLESSETQFPYLKNEQKSV